MELKTTQTDLIAAWKLRKFVQVALVAMISVESAYCIVYFTTFSVLQDMSPVNWLQVTHPILILAMAYVMIEKNLERGTQLLALFALVLFFFDGVFAFAVRYVEWKGVSAINHHKEQTKLLLFILQILFWIDDLVILLLSVVIAYEGNNVMVRKLYGTLPNLQKDFLSVAFLYQLTDPKGYADLNALLFGAEPTPFADTLPYGVVAVDMPTTVVTPASAASKRPGLGDSSFATTTKTNKRGVIW